LKTQAGETTGRIEIEHSEWRGLDENIGAISVELTPDDLRDIHTAASKITVQGARYPEKLEKMTGR
jgi:hypothetical protein